MGCYSSTPEPPPGFLSTEVTGQSKPAGIPGLPPRVKLVLLGSSGVGKSCIALRYVKGTFDPSSRCTIGAAFLSHPVPLPDGKSIKFEIWDTAGQERYQSLAPLYYRGAHAAAVVYDITDTASYEKSKYWIEELQKNASGSLATILIGNKSDLGSQRKIGEQEASDFADSQQMMFIETSAKTGANVAAVFESLAAKLAGGLPISSNPTT